MSLAELAARSPTPPVRLEPQEVGKLLGALGARWTLDGDTLERRVAIPTYATGVALVAAIGKLADELDHHPEVRLRWGTLDVQLWTHDVQGLSELDFILAARIEQCITEALDLQGPA